MGGHKNCFFPVQSVKKQFLPLFPSPQEKERKLVRVFVTALILSASVRHSPAGILCRRKFMDGQKTAFFRFRERQEQQPGRVFMTALDTIDAERKLMNRNFRR